MNNNRRGIRSFLVAASSLAGLAAQLVTAAPPPGFSPILPPPFQADDRVVSDPSVSVMYPEFDRINFRVAWQGAEGNLWLGNVDPKTGDLVLPNGQASIIDTGLPPYAETKQGPEWAFGTDGTYLVYAKGSSANYTLTAAKSNPDGSWTHLSLPNAQGRFEPYGTPEWNATFGPARTVYRGIDPTDGKQFLHWRRLDAAFTERKVRQESALHPQFVEGQNFMVMTVVPGGTGVRQVATQNLTPSDQAPPVVITSDAGSKRFPQMWVAPEYQGLVVAAVVDHNAIAVYRRIAGVWRRVQTLTIPSQYRSYNALRAFVYEGKSYLAIVAAEQPEREGEPLINAEIWLAGIDPAAPFFRQVSDPTAIQIRKDPAVFFTRSGPVIFYTQKDAATGNWLLRRAATGLRPDYGYDHPAYGGAWSVIHRDNKNCDCVPFKIADRYEEDHRPILPHIQVVRLTIGPEGNTYYPYMELGPSGNPTGRRFFTGFDTYTSGTEQLRLTEAQCTGHITANNNLIGVDGNFYLSGNEAMNKFTPTGQLLWQTPIRGVATSAQFAPDGKVVFFSWNGWAYVLDPLTGAVLMEKEMDPGRVYPATPTCLVLGNSADCAYVNTPAVDPFHNIVYNTFMQRDGHGAVDAYRYETNPPNLTLLWRNSILAGGSASSIDLSADYTRLYVHDQIGNLIALDAASGAVIWTFPIGYVANASPNTSDNGYIVAGGTQTDPDNTNFIGVIKDFGTHADWVFKDFTYRPESAAAFGRNDRMVVMGRNAATGTLALLVIDPTVGIVSATPWADGPNPPRFTGIAIREDGWVFVNMWGESAYKAYRPATAP